MTRVWFDSEKVQEIFIFSIALRAGLGPPSLIFSCLGEGGGGNILWTEKWS